MPSRFFISHSSIDKTFAIALKGHLGPAVWVDLYEMEVGDLLLQEITAGIEQATDFVILWSSAAVTSKWVQFEFHMAFVRWLEDQAVALRIICLDSTELPLYFRPFLQSREASDPAEVASLLMHRAPKPPVRRSFFNRNQEIDQIEAALYAPAVVAVWMWGVAGVGKRSLVAEAIRRLTSSNTNARSITVNSGVAEPELNLMLSSALSTAPADPSEPTGAISEDSATLLDQFTSVGGIWVFEEAQHWLEDDGSPGRVAMHVLNSIEAANGGDPERLVIFTSTRRPHLRPPWNSLIKLVQLKGLRPDFGVALLRSREAQGTAEELRLATEELDGHPLALELAAPKLPAQPYDFSKQRIRLATDLIASTRLSRFTWHVMEALAAVAGPFPAGDLAASLSLTSEQLQTAVAEGDSHGLIQFSEISHLVLHPLVRDFYLRSFRQREDSDSRLDDLASRAKEYLTQISATDPTYVDALLSTFRLLGLSGRLEEAQALHRGLTGTLYATADLLYQERRYELALRYLEETLTGNESIDRDPLLLKARCLAYLGKVDEARELGNHLVARSPVDVKVLRVRGRIEYIDKNWREAIRYFEAGLSVRPRNPALLGDLAQAMVRIDDWERARVTAKASIDSGGDTPYTLNLYSQILEHHEEFVTAEEMMRRAVRGDPTNPAYRHRLGRIAQQQGKRMEARDEYRKSVELDPRYHESWLSLASISADLGEYILAEDALAHAEALPRVPKSVVSNVKAKIALMRGELNNAQEYINDALRHARDRQNLGLAMRVLIQRAYTGDMATARAKPEIALLVNELDAMGYGSDIDDMVKSWPDYFNKE